MDVEEVELEDGAPTPTPESGEEPGRQGGDDKADKAELAELRKEIQARDRRLAELEESERYWAGKAKGGKDKDEDEPEDEADEPEPELPADDPEKLADELGTHGIKALEKRGVLTAKQAKQMMAEIAEKVATKIVGKARDQIANDSRLMQQYPELNDPKSELFERTKVIYKEMLGDDPALKNSRRGLELAARAAKAELASEKRATRRYDEDDERVSRIRRQAGDRGRRHDDDEGEGDLGPGARDVIKAFRISEDVYRKHRDAGRR